jgi:spermidine/putrescine-binding protein
MGITQAARGDFLERMAASSRERARRARAARPEAALLADAQALPAPPALALEHFDVIAELKLRSPAAPQVGATLVKATHYSSPNLAALPLLDPADLNNPMLYPDDDARQRLFFLVIVDPATTQIYNQIWADLMTSPNFQAPPKSN